MNSSTASKPHQAIIVGAGAAGLSIAAMLARRGVDALVLEREQRVGMSWARRYESLCLNTPRLLSSMPRYRMPRKYGRWPGRDDVVEYLRDYRRRLDLPVETGVEVKRIDRVGPHWRLQTASEPLEARVAVVATGHDHDPLIPDWPGVEGYPGELIHSSSYREPSRFRGRDVLVVSARNSGSEIAYELARSGAGRVRVAMRTPPNTLPREWLGIALMYTALPIDPFPDRVGDQATKLLQRVIYGDLSAHGLPPSPVGSRPTPGGFTARPSSTPASSRPCGRARSNSSPRCSPSTAARPCSPTARVSPPRR